MRVLGRGNQIPKPAGAAAGAVVTFKTLSSLCPLSPAIMIACLLQTPPIKPPLFLQPGPCSSLSPFAVSISNYFPTFSFKLFPFGEDLPQLLPKSFYSSPLLPFPPYEGFVGCSASQALSSSLSCFSLTVSCYEAKHFFQVSTVPAA